MSLSIDELTKPLTEDQVLERLLTIIEDLGLPARSWRKGGVARTILRAVARTYAGFTELMAAAIKSGFLETADGAWLRLLAKFVYGVDFIPATFATGTLQFTNAGGGIYGPFQPGEVRALWPISATENKAYTNTEIFTLNPGDVKLVAFQAVELGSASSAPPGDIDTLETTMLGVTVTNLEAFVGTDDEADEDLRQRCKDKLAALSFNGPRGAYAYAVRSAKRTDGSAVDVNRLQVSPSSSTGIVNVWVASSSGAPIPSDLVFIADSIERIARPDSVTVNVYAATEVALSKSLTVWAKKTDGLSDTDLASIVDAALIAMTRTYPIGGIKKPPSVQGYLYATTIEGTAKGAHPAIFAVDGVGADLPLADGQVATLATTITVRFVEVT